MYEELASILRKTTGLADVLRQALLLVSDQLQFAAVFGSVASGKATSSSDIDLLLVGELSFVDAGRACIQCSNSLAARSILNYIQ